MRMPVSNNPVWGIPLWHYSCLARFLHVSYLLAIVYASELSVTLNSLKTCTTFLRMFFIVWARRITFNNQLVPSVICDFSTYVGEPIFPKKGQTVEELVDKVRFCKRYIIEFVQCADNFELNL